MLKEIIQENMSHLLNAGASARKGNSKHFFEESMWTRIVKFDNKN